MKVENMRIGRRYAVPDGVLKKLPRGITQLNTLGYRYYVIEGYSRKLNDWYQGMFIDYLYDWVGGELIIDLEEMAWWLTGKDCSSLAARLEQERTKETT